MTVPDVHAPAVGEHGAPCPVCAAPLAGDQRYCLSCGTRRTDARLAFREILNARAATPAATVAQARAGVPLGRRPDDGSRSGLLAVAAIGCLLLALGVGVLIGSAGGSDPAAPAAAPQVIQVGGATGVVGAAPAAADSGGAGTPKKSPGTTSKSSTKNAGSTATPQKSQLKQLEKLSPSEYQKQSTKLPKTVGTGGAPPKKDSKPAGGGGNFETIG